MDLVPSTTGITVGWFLCDRGDAPSVGLSPRRSTNGARLKKVHFEEKVLEAFMSDLATCPLKSPH